MLLPVGLALWWGLPVVAFQFCDCPQTEKPFLGIREGFAGILILPYPSTQ